MMKFKLIRYRDIDLESFGKEVPFYLGMASRKSLLKIFGTNEKGLIILAPQYNGFAVQYLFVKADFRRQGVAKDLIDTALAYCIRYHKVLEFRILFTNPIAEGLERHALRRNMIVSSLQRIYIFYRKNFDTAIGRDWVYGRMKKVVDRFQKKGYCLDTFGNAPEEILQKLKHYCDTKNTPGWETPGDMNPFHIAYDPCLSFICWKDGEPVSYICNKRYGDSVVSKEIFCFRRYFSLGVAILPLYAFTDGIMKDVTIQRGSLMIMDNNTRSALMMARDYATFSPSVTIQKTYAGNAKLIS